jgi:uncharacterized protein YcbK (DUF882 family)
VNRICKAQGEIETIGERVWRISLVALLLMGLSLMCILMVNVPGSRATAAASPQMSTIAARTTQEPNFDVPTRRKQSGVQVASLGHDGQPLRSAAPSLTGRAVRWIASSGCLDATLRRVIGEVAASFGPVTVNSTCRSVTRNAAVGGARHSYHLSGSAADIRIHSNASAVHAYLSAHRSVGGLKHYGGGLFHVDVGPRRTW